MKKVCLLLIMAVLVVFAVACGSDSSNEGPEGEEAQEAKTNESAEATDNQSTGAETEEESEEIVVQHELGETPVKKNPENIVVFDYGILDSLDRLGVEVAGVAQDSLPTYLAKYEDDQYANIGSLKEPDFEKIHELQPDLIIISGRQAELYDQLSEIAPTIHLGVDFTRYMDSFQENMNTLGAIFGAEDEIEEELAAVDEAIQALNEKASASGANALIILANDGKVSAYGPDSRFGFIHDVFGFAPVDENIEASTHGMSISFEYIVEKDPDYLFVIDRGAVVGGESSAQQMLENDLIKNTQAYENDRIVYLDPEFWYLSGGGLVSVSEMVKEVDSSIK